MPIFLPVCGLPPNKRLKLTGHRALQISVLPSGHEIKRFQLPGHLGRQLSREPLGGIGSNMYELLRVGLILIGLYLALSSVLGFVSSSADAFSSSRDLPDFFGTTLTFFIPYAALGFAPAILLVAANRRIARWCFPDSTPPDLSRTDVLVGSGVAIVGAYLLASGVSVAAGSLLAAAISWAASGETLRSTLLANATGTGIVGAFRALMGLALLYFASRIAGAFLARSPKDAA
jgi:hypothetical protein